MKTPRALLSYRAERDDLLRRMTRALEQDPRLVAAWLFGSLGRDDGDELSDLDVWIVTLDEHIHDIVARRGDYVAQIQEPVLVLEAPQNAPEGGGYLMVYYDGATGPHQVDWYWQPQSRATVPGETRLLFDRVGLPHIDTPVKFAHKEAVREIVEQPRHFIGFFWAMLLITAKSAVRSPWSSELKLLPYVLGPLQQTQRFLRKTEKLLTVDELPSHQTPGEKLKLLRQLAEHMRAMMPKVATLGREVPDAIVPGVYRYIDLIEEIIREQTDT